MKVSYSTDPTVNMIKGSKVKLPLKLHAQVGRGKK